MRKLLWAILILLALAVLVAGGGLWYLHSSEPDYERDAVIPDLERPVEVGRDSLGVPYVRAESDADLFRALGYLHAQDRLWQMELFRRVADGRMAEILGPDLVESDRFLRTLGLGRAAEEQTVTLGRESRRLLEAYAAGVNAWIDGHKGSLPPEFVALRFEPEPWTVRNSISIAKIMAWDLADWNEGLDLQQAVDKVGAELAGELYPRYPDWGITILAADSADNLASARARAVERAPHSMYRTFDAPLPHIPPLAAHLLGAASISHASNAWVVDGSRTLSGKPILANDPHLALRSPSLWYLAALHGGEIDVAGATIPGIPTVILGHTPTVAWGFTNAMVDDVDFFIEQIHPSDPTLYRTPDGWRPLEIRAETIQVRGAAAVVYPVRTTRHGPVLSDVEDRGGSRVLAMRWTTHDPSTTFRALVAMNRARTSEQFLRAIRDFNDPHQNIVFAAADGSIGYWMSGRVPRRRSGDGLLPVPGWTGEGDWLGYLDWNAHPHVMNPREGFIVTANNRPVADGYPFHIGQSFAEPFRAMRIHELVERSGDLTAADAATHQMDTRDAFALRYLPHAVRAARNAEMDSIASALQDWNGTAEPDSHAAALFYTWYESLRWRVGADEYGGDLLYFPRAALNRILDAGSGPWVDDVTTANKETLDELAAGAMRDAVDIVAGRTWGSIHVTAFPHALGSARILESTLNLDVGPFPIGGSPYTVNVAGYPGTQPPFRNSHGPSLRHVVDMADPDGTGGFVIPTGQSGNPFSPHYRDQTQLWREGRLWPIPLDREAAEVRLIHHLTLRPLDS